MKCIIRLYGFAGGAPRSILQHIKTLMDKGYSEIVCLAHNSDNDIYQEYIQMGCKIIQRTSAPELWDSAKYVKMYLEIMWEYQYIKNEKPDLVIVLGEINGAFYSRICAKLGVNLIIYIPGGQISNKRALRLWKNCEVICFSQENLEEICQHYDKEKVHIISNRIKIKNQFSDLLTHYSNRQSIINVLLPSRIADDKINSIKSTIRILSECAENSIPINLHVAGDGAEFNELRRFCDNIRNLSINIQLLGHVADLTEEFRWAHIVAGKGRSVIEPIMMNRIGCVIGEDGRLAFCTPENIPELYHYNFSGRNLKGNKPLELMTKTIQDISNGAIKEEDIKEPADLVSKLYSADFLPEQLEKVLSKANNKALQLESGCIWTQVARFVIGKIIDKAVHNHGKTVSNDSSIGS